MKNSILFTSVLGAIFVVASSSYCEMSCNGARHIGCNHNGRFDSNYCPRDAKIVAMRGDYIDLLVDEHNKHRNFIAGGNDKNHAKACRMATMEWDDELAFLASLNVRQCQMRHDRCRKTKAFEYSGQNLAYSWHYPAGDFDIPKELKNAVQGWFNEVENSTQAIIDSYPQQTRDPVGHFTVMMADRNTHMGCAAAVFSEQGGSTILTACNYATTNMINHPIYAKCAKAGEKCTNGKNPQYTNLCSKNEVYAVNKWF